MTSRLHEMLAEQLQTEPEQACYDRSSNGDNETQLEKSEIVIVLIVDDEEQILRLVANLLEAKGHEAMTASDGEEGLRMVEDRRPDAILLDIMMPGLDGATVAQKLGESPETSDIPIIFLTGLVDADEMSTRGPKIGGQFFLAKPFDAEKLYRVLELATTSG